LRYYFLFVGEGIRHEDERGKHFASVQAAIAHARSIAAKLGANDPYYHSLSVSVVDESGNEVARVPVGGGRA
jgi:hypothetical protein